jgi:hypothetical protein
MPMLKRPDAEIYYEVHGAGFPILLYAPGGLTSRVEMAVYRPTIPTASRGWIRAPRSPTSTR